MFFLLLEMLVWHHDGLNCYCKMDRNDVMNFIDNLLFEEGEVSFVLKKRGFLGHTSGSIPWIFLYVVTNKTTDLTKKKKNV